MNFKEFYTKIIFLANRGVFKIKIGGKEKQTKAMAEYYTLHNLEYIKIVFTDKSFLYVVPEDEEIYYSKNYVIKTTIKDFEIGNKKVVNYNGKDYYIENKDDYQFVKHIFFGNYKDIEGEVRFSDYVSKTGNDFLSLGWIVYNNKRADINPKLIDLDKIKLGTIK